MKKRIRKNGKAGSPSLAMAGQANQPVKKKKADPSQRPDKWSEADINLHRQLLQQLMEKEDYAQGKVVARHLTEIAPDDAHAWFLRGVALVQTEEPEPAERCLLKAIELGGESPWSWYFIAEARQHTGDLEEALAANTQALKLAPEQPELHRQLMNIHVQRGDLTAAIAAGEASLGQLTEADDDVRARLKIAKLQASLSDYAAAGAHLKKALKHDSANTELLCLLGHCLSRQERPKEALQAFERAAEIDTRDPVTLYNIGDAFISLEQPARAIMPLQQAVRLQHDYSLAHYDLSLAHLALKQYPEAEEAARAALREDPEMAVQSSNLGLGATENLAVAFLNQGKLEEAEDCCKRNLRLVAPTYSNLGLALSRMERYDEALKYFQLAADLVPTDEEYMNLLGDTYDELGRYDEAEACFRRAIELDPAYALGYYDLGVLLSRRRSQQPEAIEAFEQSLKLDPAMADSQYGIACCHALSHADEQALKSLEKALRKGFREFDHIDTDTDWDALRNDARFIRLLNKYREEKDEVVESLTASRMRDVTRH